MKNLNMDDSILSSGKKKNTFEKVFGKIDLRFWKNWDLIDGQKRGEILFRRFFVFAVFYVLILLLATVYGDRVKSYLAGERKDVVAVEEIVEDEEVVVEDKVEWVDGDRVTEKADGTVEVVPAEVFMDSPVTFIKKFTQSYGGSRIDDGYFTLLDKYCSDEALRTVVAISVAETGMGRDVKRQSNFFGWFKGGNRNYDPDQEIMAKEICNGVEENYLNIGNDMAKAKRYVGYVSNDWLYNYRWAYAQMEVK